MVWPRLVDSIYDWILAKRVDLAAESWFSMIGTFTRIITLKEKVFENEWHGIGD